MAVRKQSTRRAGSATKTNGSQKLTAVKEPFTKTQTLSEIADKTGVPRKDVAAVLDELSNIINRHVRKRSAGEFTMPGLFKIVTVKKPARKAQKNVPNPFKPGELMDIAARPAQTVVKVRPLKRLREMVEA